MSPRLEHVQRPQYPHIRTLLLEVYREVYADEKQEFHAVVRFAERIDMYAELDGWEAALGRTTDGDVTGYALGAPLPAGSRWWDSATNPLPQDFTAENGHRTFAVFELMVRPPWRGTGEAYRIHEELLGARTEQRATLLVDATHKGVRRRYEEWGYRAVGEQQPFADAPTYLMLLRDLPNTAA
ncbi:N-acetyltransferase [Streptomyces sp. NPDC053560]|uniref:N-acetyltransferase n=1 Tax=Streptomyces sp. NPDC053560 TaxID=3365711 RepID=UPI0037D96F3B